jgi:hypothetical protein
MMYEILGYCCIAVCVMPIVAMIVVIFVNSLLDMFGGDNCQ